MLLPSSRACARCAYFKGCCWRCCCRATKSTRAGRTDASGSGPFESGILIVLALLLYATAVRQALANEDPDALPPKWLDRAESISAPRAFLVGIGLVLISIKYWVFSMGVVGAVRESGIGVRAGVLNFVVYVALAAAIPLALIGVKIGSPRRSSILLKASQRWLEHHTGPIVITFSLVFGTWFLVVGLQGL